MLAVCRLAGIAFMATGGTGGVDRGFVASLDSPPILPQIARTRALVVSSGAKSILHAGHLLKLLETLGVPVLGGGTSMLPLFDTAAGLSPVSVWWARRRKKRPSIIVVDSLWELNDSAGVLLSGPASR